MKKVLKLVVAIILAILILAFLMFLIDCSLVNSSKEPLFASKSGILNDGGTVEYMGLGYKIIDFNRLNGYDEVKVGLWNIKYEDYKEEYEKLDEDIINNEESGDIINDTYISGDIEINDSQSGEYNSGEDINENLISGDNTNVNNDITSGEQEKEPEEKGYYFNATIIGVNGKNLIVQALEGEEITKSSDMFSFSLEENVEYLIGQKVRIKYTGTIRESYPAQIDVLELKVIE